ncbi:MAG: hypothetical protein R3D28_15490 [Geminicoccaceae bacterium]
MHDILLVATERCASSTGSAARASGRCAIWSGVEGPNWGFYERLGFAATHLGMKLNL